MRRTTFFAFTAAALVLTASATASLQPVHRTFGNLTIPRVRAGTVNAPPAAERGLARVIVTLPLAPLAAAYGRTLAARTAATHLEVASASSRAYLARVSAAQARAVVELHAAIPAARISRRFQILLDGLTVTLPVKQLPHLMRLGFVRRVYPSYRYNLALNDSPSIIGATALSAATGARGDGIKIGVVDDGIDQTNIFFNPAGFQYPAGFPKGDLSFTTPKVIVARAFPGPGSGKGGTLPLDRQASFHGTHVAGIAAGDAGTTAPAGIDHPLVTGLSGVAPRAWLGNYRVFNVPGPFGGDTAETPEIIAAFESAVADGMNVINFSGGGAQSEPANDAMIETVRNVVAAGVVPVIAAGNDRDDFGLGTVGSPGTAPDAITVAAVSNNHVFGQTLGVSNPPISGPPIPFQEGAGTVPATWSTADQTLVDIGTIVGTDGKPVDRLLCGPANDLEAASSKLPAHSLDGMIALVSRGSCTFVSKALRAKAAGAVGIVVVDNRSGEANPIPIALAVPGGMVADLDGARLRAAMAATAGRATMRIGPGRSVIETGRSGIPASFSSAGPTAFGHELKPDISAPGSQILSSTLKEFAGEPFAVFDGTSMATPHIAGAAALLLQRHPGWTPGQVKSALMSTAGPAYADTARTTEASVLLEGAGLAQLVTADNPKIFTKPQSLSFQDVDVNRGAASRPLLVAIDDAGGGAGVWQVGLEPQSATAGTLIDTPATVSVAPGGESFIAVVARSSADAVAGDDYGFVVLKQGDATRRIPYFFSVTRPKLEFVTPTPLKPDQIGSTATGENHANVYRWPSAPFGPGAFYAGLPPVDEGGADKLYSLDVGAPLVNFGAVVLAAQSGAAVDVWALGSPDENDVQGYAGTPVNVNNAMFDYRVPVSAAGAGFPLAKTYYISVDSPSDPTTGKVFGGRYLLRAWENDLEPPIVVPVTRRVAAGRPTLVLRVGDLQSGVDPLSLAIAYGRTLVGAAFYDPVSGLAVFPLPSNVPALKAGSTPAVMIASDYQETKNVATLPGPDVMPNTAFDPTKLTVVNGPAVTWLSPIERDCAASPSRLLVIASDTKTISSVTFYDGTHKIATVTRGPAGLFGADWRTKGLTKGSHSLRAVLKDRAGKTVAANESVRVCTKAP